MKKYLLVAFLSGVVGFAAGAFAWYAFSPLLFDEVVSETAPSAATAQTVRSGTFQGADFAHKGAGNAEILQANGETIVRFTDFSVTNGPQLHVWLVKADSVSSSGDVTATDYIDLGRLKGNVGDQNYVIPAGTDLDEYSTVVVWCKPFGVLFSHASLS